MRLLPEFCPKGEDGNFLECCVRDTIVLQAISRRVHFGYFFIEIKYRSDMEGYQKLVRAGDSEGIIEKLRDPQQEKTVLDRVHNKAVKLQLEPEPFVNLFRDFVIPLTIQAQ